MSDLRFTIRRLAKSPGFTSAAILILALGIGINTTLFSIIDHVLLRPFVFPESDRLVCLVERSGNTAYNAVNYDNYLDWRKAQRSFSSLGAARVWSEAVVGSGEAEHLTGAQVSFEYLVAAGVPPLRGRLFTPEEDQPKAERTLILSESLWRRRFGGEDVAIGAKMRIRDESYTIIGVLPRGAIQPAANCEFWVPLAHFTRDLAGHPERPAGPLVTLARLKPGVSVGAAQLDMISVAQQLEAIHPVLQGRSILVSPLNESLLGSARPTLLLLLGAASGVLLIACANLASLQLSRVFGRQREFAIRTSLGASRARLIRLLLGESFLLAFAGCVAGLLLAAWSLEAVRTWLPTQFPRVDGLELDQRAFFFAVGAGLLSVVLSSVAAVWYLIRSSHRTGLITSSSTHSRASGHRWLFGLVTTQIAVTCLLLVGTGLMLRSLHQLYRASLGFIPTRVVSFSWAPPVDDAPRAELLERAVAQLSALPGVSDVGVISEMPLGGDYFIRPLSVEGMPPPPPSQQPQGASFSVTPSFFRTMGIPVLRGRSFAESDNDAAATKVAIIDTRLAERHFPGQDPIGRRIKFGTLGDRRPWVEIVGVVEHLENRGLGSSGDAQAYIPYRQRGAPPRMAFVVRTAGETDMLVGEIRQTMRALAPEVPIYSLATMDDRFASTIAPHRLVGGLLGLFAGLGVVLAAIGLYGVLTYQVSQRTRELGIRMALGAQPGQILAMVVRQGLRVAGCGVLMGLVGALATSRLLQSLLYHITPTDAPTLAGVVALVFGGALLACWLPARRATRIDPVEALRAE